MSPWALAVWLPLHLLLLWLPGCCLLRGPSRVTGTEGETLSLQCWYEEKYKTYSKYWCKRTSRLPICADTVKTKGSDREASRGQVSIHDHPENLTFTVTLKNSSLEDTGSYWCGIRTPWLEGWDDIFVVEVSVFPGTTPVGKTSIITTRTPAVPSTIPAKDHPTQGPSSQEDHHKAQGPGLLTPLSLLVLLLLLLVGASLLVWRILQRRVKAGEPPELSQNLRQAAERSEPQYANLQLHSLGAREGRAAPRQAEVEYSTVVLPTKGEEDLHYSSVVFNAQKQDSNVGRPQEEAEYSVIQKPGKTPNPPLPPS
ncbi:CMRF35-like molecule 8 [Perognathus longimembris pacificus]|uniref:CMRF35-like molecule 8 n=1 Tax=Perognathus longimembris pacificus TaxID=214514 RepID=UPI0020188AA0|nr:CMRF35-like molecule 8 [Perognathus longimembris pacificus]